ncbi:MAG: iron-only hydrogenase system regulator [Oscillospiraceae bacterium]|jgi:putative iron-only hydrogenase system regulator|nr:iron-only hydrogenase system regulator [Oscillospiraceae bacterium]
MARAAVISAILDHPALVQTEFNTIVSEHHHLLWGRMGIPVNGGALALISLTVVGNMDEINQLTGRLGALPHVSVKTAVSTMEIDAYPVHAAHTREASPPCSPPANTSI